MGASLYSLVIKNLLLHQLTMAQFFEHIFAPKVNRKARFPENHLGAFGRVGKNFEEVLMLCKLVEYTAKELCALDPACWAVTNRINRGARTVMERVGFQVIDEIRLRHRVVVVYEFQP